jgi:hypothetical protein
MSAFGGKADMPFCDAYVCLGPRRIKITCAAGVSRISGVGGPRSGLGAQISKKLAAFDLDGAGFFVVPLKHDQDRKEEMAAKKRPKNAPTIEQLNMLCRHVVESMESGMSENWAIRLLEQVANMYAKYRVFGYVAVDSADQYTHWSKAALAAKAANPKLAAGGHLRVEHGTPRRAFARVVLAAYREGKLTKEWMDAHCATKWKVAVITHDEDKRLNVLGRSKEFSTPDERWAAAKIEF